MIRGFHHVAINTANLDRLVDFYCNVFGFEVVQRFEYQGYPVVDELIGLEDSAARQTMVRAGNACLELFEYAAPPARDAEPLRPCDRGYTHICFEVTDVDAEYQRLVTAGMTFKSEPIDFGEIKTVYGHDPDGNIIELQQVPAEHDIAFDKLHFTEASA